jgi:hypothetical protein
MVRNLGCIFKMLFGFTVLLCMGYFALMALNPKARQWALQGTQPGPGGTPATGKGPTPFQTVNQVLAIPAQALAKTDDVVQSNNARVGLLDGVIKEEEEKNKGARTSRTLAPVTDPFTNPTSSDTRKKSGPAASSASDEGPTSISPNALLALAEKQQPAPPTPDPKPQTPDTRATTPAVDPDLAPDQLKLAGDILIAQASPPGAPRASRAFFYWVVSLNISGITQGPRARLLLNNRLTYEGDEVHRTLGITFLRLDAPNRLLVFRDNTGAVVTRSY